MPSPWIDITMPYRTDMVVWPGMTPPALHWNRHFKDGFRSINSTFSTNMHTGTHVDAPLHFQPGGASVETVDLDACMGPAVVVDATAFDVIDDVALSSCVPDGATRILLRTKNSVRRLDLTDFDETYVALDVRGARWLAAAGIRLVANDFPSIAVFKGDSEIHTALMDAGVVIVEGVLLHHVHPGNYELACLPLLVEGAEAAPARVAIRPI